jgi:ATP-dependent Clp protease ATP-binding subunit ClpC
LKYLVVVLFGIAFAWLWPRLRARAKIEAGEPLEPVQPQLLAPADDASANETPAEAEPESEPLGARLARLQMQVDADISSSAPARDLAAHPKFIEARRMLADPDVPIAVVGEYAIGSNWFTSCAALAALADRPDRDEAVSNVLTFFDTLTPWGLYFALKLFVLADPRPPVGAPFTAVRDYWRDNTFAIGAFREYLDDRAQLGDVADFGTALRGVSAEAQAPIKAFLARLNHPLATALIDSLEAARLLNVDRAFLTSFGTFWKSADAELLVEPEQWTDGLKEAEAKVLSGSPRSLLASGESRTGKTSFLRLLGKRLERTGWSVFEAGGAELMAGQQWFGQLEGRIQRTVEELSASKKLIWYIPDILQIAMSGTHQGQAASILDQILPAISTGRLIVWTETSASGASRLLRLRPALRSIFEMARLEPMDQEDAAELAGQFVAGIAKKKNVIVEPAAIDVALASARQYLSSYSLPGSALDLLKLSVGRAAAASSAAITPGDVIDTLAQFTGLPASILDSRERVDLASVRAYFSARVIGQDEAVDAIVARIAMLKAGLNDPGKPIGTFLFAGPTGTGKTELAKTLAEFLFGSQDRMVRLDMSEFQTPDSTFKILGSGDAAGPSDSLITLVRKQPFSVVLLDEFEKAHANVWDLFLQVFDDGRLTDQVGQVADFRHCIIILTSNLGATSHRGPRLGFSAKEEAYSSDQVMRAVAQTFRPEFQNRLDKVIVFRPLSRELMRDILKKELARVLDRRGLKDREWAVEWEASALEFLLEKGFSPEMGARPLKRAIDQYLIAPLAATIVEQRFPEGDQFVFVRSDGRAIQAEFVDPDLDGPVLRPIPPDGEEPTLPAIILAPQGSSAELYVLHKALDRIGEDLAADQWEGRKTELSAQMQTDGFWSNPQRHAVLAQLALIDRVQTAAETAQSLKLRLDKGTERSGKSSRELTSRLALQLHLVNDGLADVSDRAPIEVAVAVEPAFERPGELKPALVWCGKVLDMYRAWCRKRNMQLTELQIALPNAAGSLPVLLIAGFGAHRTLKGEQGLHVLELGEDKAPARATARVRIGVAPLGDMPESRFKAAIQNALNEAGQPNAVVRRYRDDASPLVRDLVAGWRSGRLDDVLGGDFDLIGANLGASQ